MIDTLNVMNTFLKRQELFDTVFTLLQKRPQQGTSKISGVWMLKSTLANAPSSNVYKEYHPIFQGELKFFGEE